MLNIDIKNINSLPKFCQPLGWKNYVRLCEKKWDKINWNVFDTSYQDIIPLLLLDKEKNYITLLNIVKENMILQLNNSPMLTIIDDNINYTPDIPDDMIQCDNCGNIWDGNAQCNCYYSSDDE